MYTYTCMQVCTKARMYVCMYTCTHGWRDGWMDVIMCKYAYIHTYMHLDWYVSTYTYTYERQAFLSEELNCLWGDQQQIVAWKEHVCVGRDNVYAEGSRSGLHGPR